jgi:hypothetical protein
MLLPTQNLGLNFGHLLSFSKLLQDLESLLVVGEQVVGHGYADPGGPLCRPQLEQLVAGFLKKNGRQLVVTGVHTILHIYGSYFFVKWSVTRIWWEER